MALERKCRFRLSLMLNFSKFWIFLFGFVLLNELLRFMKIIFGIFSLIVLVSSFLISLVIRVFLFCLAFWNFRMYRNLLLVFIIVGKELFFFRGFRYCIILMVLIFILFMFCLWFVLVVCLFVLFFWVINCLVIDF